MAKTTHLSPKSNEPQKVKKAYYEYCKKAMDIPKPDFFNIEGNSLILIENQLSESQIYFLSKYISASKNESDKIIKKLYLVDCKISDSMFSQILLALRDQDR